MSLLSLLLAGVASPPAARFSSVAVTKGRETMGGWASLAHPHRSQIPLGKGVSIVPGAGDAL